MRLDLAPFPIRDDLRAGESGHGYALRMATSNALNALPAVKAMLGKTRFAVLDVGDAGALSRWFGGNSEQLARALGRTATGAEPETYELGGAILTRSYFVNRSQPRICGECLDTEGYCRLAWELSASTTCATHRKRLQSRCAHCGQALRWDRPHVSQCRCGGMLNTDSTDPALASAEELEISAWIETAFGYGPRWPPKTPLGRLFEPLGLDAGLHILSALSSVRPDGPKAPASGRLRIRNSVAHAQEMILSAAGALASINAMPRGVWKVPVSAIELLAEACASSYGAADRQLALSILARLRCHPPTATWQGRFPQMSQLVLF